MYPEPLLNLQRQPNISSERSNTRRFYLRYKSEMRQEFCPRSVGRSFVQRHNLCVFILFFSFLFNCQKRTCFLSLLVLTMFALIVAQIVSIVQIFGQFVGLPFALPFAERLLISTLVQQFFWKWIAFCEDKKEKNTGKYSMAKRCSNSFCVHLMVILANILNDHNKQKPNI